MLGGKCMDRLTFEELAAVAADESNSVAIIVKHISGNMLSRWTDFLTSDGEKPWRNRDGEFANDINSKEELVEAWERGWACFKNALNSINDNNIENIVYIRNEGHTVIEALNRQLAHYAYHVGQMVYIAKKIKEGGWESLSVPKGKSADFNREKFSKEKQRKHFI
jgi:hypothetical protein